MKRFAPTPAVGPSGNPRTRPENQNELMSVERPPRENVAHHPPESSRLYLQSAWQASALAAQAGAGGGAVGLCPRPDAGVPRSLFARRAPRPSASFLKPRRARPDTGYDRSPTWPFVPMAALQATTSRWLRPRGPA
ncbi:uncharacterized protein A4U43_C07F17350 [Asparagus officinalis]|uniref:Uncharacterized protein n=1 Tax=Asparagus officinalis TaxID=4686 RepID=A0A5P1EFN4_ASPOF|nr:uncharacterized protein A4U43_C07F17350 [Asparagus officinalis]